MRLASTLLLAFICASAGLTARGAESASVPPPTNLVLENSLYRLEVDPLHGRLLRLLDKAGKVDLVSPPAMAENFRLYLPTPADARNFVAGKDQSLSRHENTAGALTLHWAGPMTDQHGAAHKLSAAMRVLLEGESVVFYFSMTNGTGLTVREVWYPAIGGLLGFGPADARASTTLSPPPHDAKRFTRPFGGYALHYPSMNMGFVQVDNRAIHRGMYLGAHDPVARFKTFSFTETRQGDAANVTGWLMHYPFTKPGATFEGSPFVVQFHPGDWIAGGRQIYKPWFAKQFGLMKPKDDWIRQQSFFQMIMIMLPEGNINYTIKQIPQLARDGLKYGVTSLQIAGWQCGGHDNGYPYYEPDPRLGTYDDLKEAIRQCHELGVKVYFFANLTVNNMDTTWYRSELKDYNFEGLHGHPCWVAGWGMGTLASRMGLTTPLMSFADTSFPKLADAHLGYFKRLAEIGADGVHLDKTFPQPINFNPRVVMSPDESPWEGTIRLVERIDRECRAIHPDWRMSFECNWDRLLSFGDATWWAGNMSTARKIFPELVETVGLSAPYDYITVNDAVRKGHAIMVDPHDFCTSMDDPSFRGLAGYIREVKKIRDALADYVFTGEPIDASEAEFAQDQPRPAGLDHAVYRHLTTGKRACILSHRGAAEGLVVLNGFKPAGRGKVSIYRPGNEPVLLDLPASITVGAERVVFVVEN